MGFLDIGWTFLELVRRNDGTVPYSEIWNTIANTLGLEEYLVNPINFGGAAVKQLAHYGQCVKSKNFQRWDYGLMGNLNKYGTLKPPLYDMTKMTVPTTLHYTESDNVVGVKDVLKMEEVLPNAISRKVADKTFKHTGFVFARKVKVLVNDYIVETLSAAENL